MTATIDRLQPIFERVLEGPIAGFGPATSFADVNRWDSVTHIALLLEIEAAFGVEFNTEDLGRLLSVAAIAEVVDELSAGRAGPR